MLEREVRVTPWGTAMRPDESQIMQLFAAENLRPYRWSNGPHDIYSAHSHTINKVIIVLQGSITFGLPEDGRQVELFTGDRLDLPQGTVHNAVVGPDGVVCLEAHH
jgi:quercetin dioxygenase-like cupin family protein